MEAKTSWIALSILSIDTSNQALGLHVFIDDIWPSKRFPLSHQSLDIIILQIHSNQSKATKRKVNKWTNRKLGFLGVQVEPLLVNFGTELDLGLLMTSLLGILLWFILQKRKKEKKIIAKVLKPTKDGVSKGLRV
jgi:hypothetical protein